MKRREASLGPVMSARESVQSLQPINLRHTRRWRTLRVYSPLRLAYDTCVLPAWRAPYIVRATPLSRAPLAHVIEQLRKRGGAIALIPHVHSLLPLFDFIR